MLILYPVPTANVTPAVQRRVQRRSRGTVEVGDEELRVAVEEEVTRDVMDPDSQSTFTGTVHVHLV
jgi:hypothetical protein